MSTALAPLLPGDEPLVCTCCGVDETTGVRPKPALAKCAPDNVRQMFPARKVG